MGEMASSFEYGLNAAAKEFDGKNKYIRITDIYDDSREFDQNNITSPDIDLLNVDNYKLTKGDISVSYTHLDVYKRQELTSTPPIPPKDTGLALTA